MKVYFQFMTAKPSIYAKLVGQPDCYVLSALIKHKKAFAEAKAFSFFWLKDLEARSGNPTVTYYPPLSNIKKAFAEAKAFSFFC